jgi:HPt (histidine-containing phosphotransfer) domain-containing protein
VTGRYAAALRFSEDNVEVHGVARGLEGMGIEGGDSAQLILDLPENTAGAISLEHGDQLVANAYKMFSEQMPDEVAEVEAQASEAGFTLPEDIQTIVGSSLVLSVGPGIVDVAGDMEDLEALEIAYRTETDTDKAEELLGRVLEASGEPDADQFLLRRSDDGVFSLAVSQSYLDEVAEGGALSNHKMFQSAVPNADAADSVFYVNVNAFEDLYLPEVPNEDARTSLEQLGAIGFSSTVDEDGNGAFTLRFVADGE